MDATVDNDMLKKNDLVELESGCRMFIGSIDGDIVRLSIRVNGTFVAHELKENLTLVSRNTASSY